MNASDWIALGSLFINILLGAGLFSLKLFVENQINAAKDAILARVDADYACEDTVRLQFRTQGREIGEMKKRIDRHGERISQVERRVGTEGC